MGADGGVRWGPLLRRGGGEEGGGGCGVGPCAGGRCRWERADSRLFSTGRRSDWASRPAPVRRRKIDTVPEYVLRIQCTVPYNEDPDPTDFIFTLCTVTEQEPCNTTKETFSNKNVLFIRNLSPCLVLITRG